MKRNLNADVAKIAAENLLKEHPEYQTCLGLVKFGESYFLLRVALKELKLSETDDLIVENESESVGENDVEEIEPEKAHEEKNQKQSQITDFFRTQK